MITHLGCWENSRKACKSRAEIVFSQHPAWVDASKSIEFRVLPRVMRVTKQYRLFISSVSSQLAYKNSWLDILVMLSAKHAIHRSNEAGWFLSSSTFKITRNVSWFFLKLLGRWKLLHSTLRKTPLKPQHKIKRWWTEPKISFLLSFLRYSIPVGIFLF